MTRYLIAYSLVALLAGCASTPVAPVGAKVVPVERLLTPRSDGDATITVVRDTGFRGGGCLVALYVNRQPVARVDTGEKLTLQVKSGETLLAAGRDPEGRGLCSLDTDGGRKQLETLLRPGEHKYFRIVVTSDGLEVSRSDF